MTARNLRHIVRTPQLVIFAAIQPVMFVLLFRYVFGGSIHPKGYTHYIDYLLPGIIVQTTLFAGSSSTVGVAEDLAKGMTDRFRSLPMHRGAILAGRTSRCCSATPSHGCSHSSACSCATPRPHNSPRCCRSSRSCSQRRRSPRPRPCPAG